MAQTIRLKRSAVAAKAPLTTNLALGELAINTYDGKLYFKKNVSGTETIIELANVGHVHAATDITSGTISTARLGSGTANSTTFLRGDNTWATVSGSGTVTSVAFSTGTTGLTVTGSPITSSGTITLAGTLAVANGGTGATSAATALTNLGAAADSAVVKLTGNQTIAGVKTFSSDGFFNGVRVGKGSNSVTGNICIGTNFPNVSGNNNIAIGTESGLNATTGSLNVGVGINTNRLTTTGNYNSSFGPGALQSNTTGSANIAIGWAAATHIANGSTLLTDPEGCVYIGNFVRGNSNADSNSIVIAGYTATARGVGDGANTTVIGNAETTSTKLFGKTTSQTNTATTNAVVHGLRTEHQSTGTPAVGIGTGIEFAAETAANNTEVGATIEAVTTDVTAGSEDFDLSFKLMTNGATAAEKFRIKSNGDLVLASGNLVLNTADRGIDFSQNANASGMLGEVLADYEAGTWTPTFVPQTNSFTSITYNALTTGNYVKIGNFVFLTGFIATDSLTVGTASGELYIGNLPFSLSIIIPNGFVAQATNWNVDHPCGLIRSDDTKFRLEYRNTAGNSATAATTVADLSTSGTSRNTLRFTASYVLL